MTASPFHHGHEKDICTEILAWSEHTLQKPNPLFNNLPACPYAKKAWQEGNEHAPVWENAKTIAAGIRVPVAVGDFLIIRAIKESGGFGVIVDDHEIIHIRDKIAKEDGLLLCPEGAATAAAYKQAIQKGLISESEKTNLYNCATGLKYPMPEVSLFVNKNEKIDYSEF